MLDIDYDLIPLEQTASEQVVRDARVLARRGRVPTLSSANLGRLVVVNPNQGYALHHVPDDLRKPLRRVMMPIQEGSRVLTAARLVEEIADSSDETLHAVIVEAHSDFPNLPDLLRTLPLLAKRMPRCQFLLHVEMPRLYSLLESQLSQPGTFCDLYFDHDGAPLRITGTQVLGRMLMDLPRYPTFNRPFFSEVKVRVGNQSEWFDLESVRRLYRTYGVGNVDELDITGKLRDRLIVVDLPLDAIEAIRFAEQPGESFHAVRLTDEKRFGSDFAGMSAKAREVTPDQIEMIYRRLPGKNEEELPFARVRGLRINTFDGHVSLLWRPDEQYIPLYELKGLRVGWPSPSADGQIPDVRELALHDQIMRFNFVVATEERRPRFGDVRAMVRFGYLGTLYRDNLERQAKLLEFAGRLNVACLGPLAAQTFKLLKPRGLQKVIPRETTYYLGDTLEDVESYGASRERLRDSYNEVIEALRGLFPPEGAKGIAPDLITHRMPQVLSWLHGEPPPFDTVTNAEMETVFKELQAYVKFCESEFLRLEQSQSEAAMSFASLFEAQTIALRAKQMSNLLGGQYGQPFGKDESPDFVFFGTDAEFDENGEKYFLPGISWAAVFQDADLQQLYEENDFEFSVFLEEQLSVMSYLRSQEHPSEAAGFEERYFRSRADDVREELRVLRERIGLGETGSSEEYQRACAEFEAMHRQELETFQEEERHVSEQLIDQESDYFDALARVTRYFGENALSPEELLEGGDYIEVMDRQMVQRAREVMQNFRKVLMATAGEANRMLLQKLPLLKAFLENLRNARKAQFDLLRAEFLLGLKEDYAKAATRALKEMAELQRMNREQWAEVDTNLRKRRIAAKGELEEYKLNVNRQVSESQQEITNLRDSVRDIAQTIQAPLRLGSEDGAEVTLVGQMEERMAKSETAIGNIAASQKAARQSLDAFRLLYRRQRERMIELFVAANKLLLLEQLQEPTMAKVAQSQQITTPLLPVPPVPKADPVKMLQAQLIGFNQRLASVGDELQDFSAKERFLDNVRDKLREFQSFQEINVAFQQAVTRKRMSQQAVITISNRLEELTDEARRLPEIIATRMVPAYRIINEGVFIPNGEKRLRHFQRALSFVGELKRLSFEELRREFMERAIFRRFHAGQFRKGAYFGMNPEMPIFSKLSNIFPSLSAYHNRLRANLPKLGHKSAEIVLEKLPSTRAGGIIQYCQELSRKPPHKRFTYLILPGTLSLPQALDIIHNKDAIFGGLPQLILIYISKFDSRAIRDDEALRERYFRAIRHNVVINMNRRNFVDNPDAIARALLDETLGCAFDFPLEQLKVQAPGAKSAAE